MLAFSVKNANSVKVAVIAAMAVLLGAVVVSFDSTAKRAAASTPGGGSGATAPYDPVEAEGAHTTGVVLPVSVRQGEVANEASGRSAVRLEGGQWVDLVARLDFNAVVVRYSVPKSAPGVVDEQRLDLQVADATLASLPISNRFTAIPCDGPGTGDCDSSVDGPTHFFDEARTLLDRTVSAGQTLRVRVPAGSSPSVVVDFADFELVGPALVKPADAVVFAGDPTGDTDSRAAMKQAVAAAKRLRVPVWIPKGRYYFQQDPEDSDRERITVDEVTIQGAGMWRSELFGAASWLYGNAQSGDDATVHSSNVHMRDFAITGVIGTRVDHQQQEGIGGAFVDSSFSRMWIEHVKSGVWLKGPSKNVVIDQMRVRNTSADGINLAPGTSYSIVQNSAVRTSGDDALASFSGRSQAVNAHNQLRANTVQTPARGNGIAVYGGADTVVANNLIIDAGAGAGIELGHDYDVHPFSGHTVVSGNTIVRSGEHNGTWKSDTGALYLLAGDDSIAPDKTSGSTQISDLVIDSAPYAAIGLHSFRTNRHPISGVEFSNVRIIKPGAATVSNTTGGSASLRDVVVEAGNAGVTIDDHGCSTGFRYSDGAGSDALMAALGNRPFRVLSPQKDAQFVPGQSYSFTGCGTAGARIELTPHGVALSPVSATVAPDGVWTAQRILGDGVYSFAGTETRGAEVRRTGVTLRPMPMVASPLAGSDHRNGFVTFAGCGIPGHTITLDPQDPALETKSVVVRPDGTWSVDRWIGNGAYDFRVVQTNAQHEETRVVSSFRLNQPVPDKPLRVLTPVVDDTFTPNSTMLFTGLGAPGAEVEIDPGHGLAVVRASVASDGSWKVSRFVGGGLYTFTIVQTRSGHPVDSPIVISLTPRT